MANRRKKIKEKAFSLANTLFPALKFATPIIAFVEQISNKDRVALGIGFSGATTGNQIKMLVNIIGGRMFGTQPFKSVVIAGVVQTINFNNVVNQWTTMGAYGIGYKLLGGAINKMTVKMGLGSNIPHTSKVGSLAKGAFGGGLLGSIFDAPDNSIATTTALSVPQLTVTSTRTSYHNISNNVGSGESSF